MPSGAMADTFELETTLHLGDADWSVVDAEPRTKPEFVGTGKLVLRLRKVEKVDLSDILYSLPSICDRIPSVLDSAPDGDDVVLADNHFVYLSLDLCLCVVEAFHALAHFGGIDRGCG